MKKKMLQFVDLKQETPVKRSTSKRKDDFNEFTMNLLLTKLKSNLADVLNAEYLFAKFIAH